MIEPRALPSKPYQNKSPWVACPRPDPDAKLRLFCLPYAGGGGSVFRQWPGRLNGSAEVCPILLPGREARFRERPYKRMHPLVAGLREGLAGYLDRPFAVFGHSMGALIAFELCRRLEREGLSPVRLLVSGSRPPHASFSDADVHGLPDEAFLDCLHRRYRAIPDAVRENRELIEIVLPALRADFELLETYRGDDGPGLTCPIVAFGGRADETVSPDELREWSRHTFGAFRCHFLDGDHFFLRSAEAALLAAVESELNPIIG